MNRKNIGIGGCEIIECLVKHDERGILSIIDSGLDFPFMPKRIFYVHNPKGIRGAHAHRKTSQFIFVLSGHLEISIDDGKNSLSLSLLSPHEGLYMPPMIWSEQFNFSNDCIYAVLACSPYSEPDYIRCRQEFDRMSK